MLDSNLLVVSFKKPVKDLFTDIAELGLDETIEYLKKDDDLLKSLPVVKWMFIANDIKTIIQAAHFTKKYASFIGPVYEQTFALDGPDKLREIIYDNGLTDRIVENTLIYLDRVHTELKAKLLGVLFVETFRHCQFTVQEYNKLMYSIDVISPFDGIEMLQEFYNYRKRMEFEKDEAMQRGIYEEGAKLEYYQLATSGLLDLPKGEAEMGSLGGAYMNEIGMRFYEHVVKEVYK